MVLTLFLCDFFHDLTASLFLFLTRSLARLSVAPRSAAHTHTSHHRVRVTYKQDVCAVVFIEQVD